jgi:hypothetical protein
MPEPQPPKAPQRSLSDLRVILESRDNPYGRPARFRGDSNPAAEFELSRISELPAIRLLAEQLGLCQPGAFSATTVQMITDRICVFGRAGEDRIDPVRANSLPLTAVAEFLDGLLKQARQNDVPPTDSEANSPISSVEPARWYTVTEAANKIAAVNPGVLSRAAKLGEIRSNGQKGHERRICALDLCRWIKDRASRPAVKESNEHVNDLVHKHVSNK